jgi:hypothetical protein
MTLFITSPRGPDSQSVEMLTCAAARWAACDDGATLALAEVAVVAVGPAAVLTEALATPVAWLLVNATLALVIAAVVTLAAVAFTAAEDDTTDGVEAVGAPQATNSPKAGSPTAAEAMRDRKSRRSQGRVGREIMISSLPTLAANPDSRVNVRRHTAPGGTRRTGAPRYRLLPPQSSATRGSPRSTSGKLTLRPLRCAA